MRFDRRTLFAAFAAAAMILAPAAEGALSPARAWPLYACAAAVISYAFFFDSERARKATLVLAAAALTLAAADFALRFTPAASQELRRRWVRMPLVNRFAPDLNDEHVGFSDLGRMAGVREWVEVKRVRVVTDSEGFRNDRVDASRPLDVILLGDSFGAGAVGQEDTWSNILARDYGLNVYNLSVAGSGPWHEYVNLRAERGRLRTDGHTVIVWQLFTGNDLDDVYGPADLNSLPWQGRTRGWLTAFNDWRGLSPVRGMLEGLWPDHDPRADVIARDFPNGRKLLFYKPYTETSFRTPEQVSAHANFARLRDTIGAIKNLAASSGVSLDVVLVPSKEEVYSWVWRGAPEWSSDAGPSGFSVMIARACGEEGIKFLDLKPELVAASRRAYEDSGQLLYWYDDTHMNAAGNALAAAAIRRELLR